MNAINWRRVVARSVFVLMGLGTLIGLLLFVVDVAQREVHCYGVYASFLERGATTDSAFMGMFQVRECFPYWIARLWAMCGILLVATFAVFAGVVIAGQLLWNWTGWGKESDK